jgi:chaperonin GroES
MLQLDEHLVLNEAAIQSPNLCDRFSDEDLTRIGIYCKEGFERDEESRRHWLKRNEAGMNLALQLQETKTFPWEGCANVAFPLVTIAAMQFHARAYPAIVNGSQVVKVAQFGPDPDGQVAARAERISAHMSWQLLYQDKPWEEQEDKAILNVSIVGTNFKKTYYSPSLGHNVSELVLAKDLTLNYWSKSVEQCPRKTHHIPKFRNEIYESVMRGIWRDCLEESWYHQAPPVEVSQAKREQDRRQGLTPSRPDEESSFMFYEQHADLDLDGDGYAEPYIITFEKNSSYVVRIVTRFDSVKAIERIVSGPRTGKIIRIRPVEYFTKKTFIPSPDGGIYDIGFGVFLGPLNEAVNSLVNMLLDAGTMQTTAGGFLARGAKIRGGVQSFSPFEWKRVDATGDDLRKSIFPLPVNAPSDVLFQLLSLLINYTSRVSGTTDITVGENPGQNTPAQTTQTMVEMGQKIYTAIFKRIWRASKEEFQKLYRLNGMFMSLDIPSVGGATRVDYLGGEDDIQPVADPHVTSETMRLQLAGSVATRAMSVPGYNRDAAERNLLKAMHVENIDEIFTGTEGMPPPKDPKVALQEIKEQNTNQRFQMELQARAQEFIAELMEEQRLNNAKIMQLQAAAAESAANAQSEQQYAQVAAVNAQLTLAKSRSDELTNRINAVLKAAEIKSKHDLGMKQLAKAAETSK